MGMPHMPEIRELREGIRFWSYSFDRFRVKVIVPPGDKLADVVNFGFAAPYLLVLEEQEQTPEEALAFAEERGLLRLAVAY